MLKALKTPQRRSVVFTGDDFGFSQGVNDGIIAAHERGHLAQASLMVTGEAFDEAVRLAKSHPRLCVGLHLVLTCGRAALPFVKIPHLVNERGEFLDQSVRAGLRYQFNRTAQRELRLEIRAQLERFRDTGLPLSHVDGHLHMHMHPVVLRALAEMSHEFGIRSIRLPVEELGITLGLDRTDLLSKMIWSWLFWRLRRYGERTLSRVGIGYVERVYGSLATGRVTEEYLLGLIPEIRAHHVEIYSHPAVELKGEPSNGPPGAGEAELAALVSPRVREALISSGFTFFGQDTIEPNGLLA